MKTILKALFLIFISVTLLGTPAMAKEKPGDGVTLKPGRATWNTGFFQEALVRRGLEELG